MREPWGGDAANARWYLPGLRYRANDESFAQEVDTTHLAIADRRRQDAAARSRSAYLGQNRQLGDKWRQKSRRAAQLGELWKPFAKKLILAGVRVAEGARFHIATDPMAMQLLIGGGAIGTYNARMDAHAAQLAEGVLVQRDVIYVIINTVCMLLMRKQHTFP